MKTFTHATNQTDTYTMSTLWRYRHIIDEATHDA